MLQGGLRSTFLKPLFGRVHAHVRHKNCCTTATHVFLYTHLWSQTLPETAPHAYAPVIADAAAPEHPRTRQAGPEGGCATGQGQNVTLAAVICRCHEALCEPGGQQGPLPLHRDAPVEHWVLFTSRGWATNRGWDACGRNTQNGVR